jgi:hypothetical protein
VARDFESLGFGSATDVQRAAAAEVAERKLPGVDKSCCRRRVKSEMSVKCSFVATCLRTTMSNLMTLLMLVRCMCSISRSIIP